MMIVSRACIGIGTAALSVSMFAAGTAHADPYVGQTFADAREMIEQYNRTAVIATVTGDRLKTDDCIVTSWARSVFLDSSGQGPDREIRVNLNCNEAIAGPGKPGNSAQSPQGRQAVKDRKAAENINANPEFCQTKDTILAWCQKVCNRTGMCEV